MKNKPQLGKNLTGAEMAGVGVKEMLEACDEFRPDVGGSSKSFANMRKKEASEADVVGSVPFPMNLKGMAKTAFDKLTGGQPEVLLDKLGQRLAFERTGVRLYEAALAKAQALNEPENVLALLENIRNDEAEHMKIVKAAIEQLGGDPTAMTPCADLTGVEGLGLMQVLSDPRTNMSQTFNILLNAELIDNAAWELLIDLANASGQEALAANFQQPLLQEQEHLLNIKTCLKDYLAIS